MQDVITVAPDRKTAKGRFHGILLGGWHDDFQETREEIMPQQFMEAGIYENDYVRENGIWKIKRLDYMMQWQANYEEGWAHTTSHLQPATKTWPEDTPIPQASVEFEVAEAAAVDPAAEELRAAGYEPVHEAREEPWGQTVARILSPEGLIVGISYAPWMHDGG